MLKLKEDNFYINWVLKDEIAIGPAPTKENHICQLKEENIQGILSLCDIKEAFPPKDIEDHFTCKRIILPDHTYKKPMVIEDLNLSLIALEEMKKKGSIFVHCKAAVERSPIICMAWLIKKHGLTMLQALNYLMSVNKGTCPLRYQLLLLNELI